MEKSKIRYHNGQELYPVQVDSATWLLVPKHKANRETADKFRETMTESRRLATKSGFFERRTDADI